MNFLWSLSQTNLQEIESPSIHSTTVSMNLFRSEDFRDEMRCHPLDERSSSRSSNILHYTTVLRNESLHIKHSVLKGTAQHDKKNTKTRPRFTHRLCTVSDRLSLSPLGSKDLVVGTCRVRPVRTWTTKNEKINKIRINIAKKNEKITTDEKNKKNEQFKEKRDRERHLQR